MNVEKRKTKIRKKRKGKRRGKIVNKTLGRKHATTEGKVAAGLVIAGELNGVIKPHTGDLL
jgi:hypothetical protein